MNHHLFFFLNILFICIRFVSSTALMLSVVLKMQKIEIHHSLILLPCKLWRISSHISNCCPVCCFGHVLFCLCSKNIVIINLDFYTKSLSLSHKVLHT